MTQKTLLWLYRELPKWVARGWLSREGAEAIQTHYSQRPMVDKPSLLRWLIVLGGIFLVLLGIFLIFAGYWYSFSPIGRFDWLILFTCMTLVGVGVVYGITPPRSAYRDGAGIFYFLAIGAFSTILGDTYPLGDSLGLYLLVTVVLSMAMAYLLDSPYLMGICLIAGACWSATNQAYVFYGGPKLAWILLLLGVPYYQRFMRLKDGREDSKLFLSWAVFIAIYLAFFFTAQQANETLTMLYLTNVAVLTYMVGRLSRAQGVWTMPFRTLSILGILYVVFLGTFTGTWGAIHEIHAIHWLDYLLLGTLFVFIVFLMRLLYVRKRIVEIIVGSLAFVAVMCALLTEYALQPFMVSVLFDLYVVFLAVVISIKTSWRKGVSGINLGGLSIVAIILGRFFDPDFTFMERGLSFLTVGAIIIIANIAYLYVRAQTVRKAKRRAQLLEQQQAELVKLEQEPLRDEAGSAVPEEHSATIAHAPVSEEDATAHVMGQVPGMTGDTVVQGEEDRHET